MARRLDAANVDLALGAIRSDVLRWDVRAEGRFRDVEQLRSLTLSGGLRLDEVAHVEVVEPRLSYGRHLDRRFAISIDVYKEASANTVATVDRLKARRK